MSISKEAAASQPRRRKDETAGGCHSKKRVVSQSWVTRSPRETVELGKLLGSCLVSGDVVGLYGELGSGKTTVTKGLAAGLGAEGAEEVRSPTFVLLNLYKGNVPIYHIDLYRVQSLERLHDIGYEEYAFGKGVVIIEWAEKAEGVLPDHAIRLWLKTLGRQAREIRVEFPGEGREICW
jgi:tRNA threonylcarbamoyladenosine biosynthesis protein TsaE